MDNKIIIVILAIIVVILSICVGFMFLNNANNNEIKNEDKNTTTVTKEVDHSKDPVYCPLCGAYVATQYEIDHAPGAGYFHDPSTGKTICDDCAAKLMEADEANYDDYETGEQDDGSYIDADGNYWSSYDEYLYTNNNP